MEQQCIRVNYDTIEHLLRSRGYEIVWKVDDDDWDTLSHGWNPQFHIRHDERVYKIQYKDHELFKVIYEFDPLVYSDYAAMSRVAIEVMSEFENTPIHFVYRDRLWQVWVGGYHLSHSDIEFYIKGYLIMIDRIIRRCQEEYNNTAN
jgi:galactose mutarotase-like enzyme